MVTKAVGARTVTERTSAGPASPAEVAEVVAARLQVLGEPTRIRLLGLLNGSPATVQQLADQLPTTPQNVSRHLGVLHQAGMVSRRKDGTFVRYALIDWTGWWLIEQITRQLADADDSERSP